MKKWLLGTLMLMIMLVAACAPRIYGVPQDRWETMSEQERIAAMEAYKARQEALRQKREEQARLRSIEKKAQLAREAEEARRRQRQIDAIYRGEGLYGDLLRVRLEGGRLQFFGDHKPFQPVSFRIAASEFKEVEIVSNRGHKARMAVHYDGSNLLLDETPKSHRSAALRLPYEDDWQVGATYTNLFGKGPLEMRGVAVTVQIVGRPPRDLHGRRHKPKVIIVQPPARRPQNPEVIVIKEPVHEPKPDVVVIHKPPRTKQPDIIVVNPRPETDNAGQIIDRRLNKNHKSNGYDAGPQPKPDVAVIHKPPRTKQPDIVMVKPRPEKEIAGQIIDRRPDKKHKSNGYDAGPPDRIKVVFRKGYVKMKKGNYALIPKSIDLRKGQVRTVRLSSQKGNLKIRLSYLQGALLIDDTPGRSKKHTRLGYVPGWKEGQPYVIESSSNRQLADLDLLVLSQ